MPLFEYQCEQCGVTFEVIQKFSDHSVVACRTCGGKVRRLASAPAIQFKGTGWYITDYARKGDKGADKEKAGAPTSESGAASAAAPSTPASGTDAKSTSGSSTPAPAAPSSTSDKK